MESELIYNADLETIDWILDNWCPWHFIKQYFSQRTLEQKSQILNGAKALMLHNIVHYEQQENVVQQLAYAV